MKHTTIEGEESKMIIAIHIYWYLPNPVFAPVTMKILSFNDSVLLTHPHCHSRNFRTRYTMPTPATGINKYR